MIVDVHKDFENGDFATRHGKMHYLHHNGAGKTILFLHGFAGSIKTWTRLMNYIPDDFNIYLIDLLGHGESESPTIDYTLEMHYESISDFIDSLVSGAYSLFGHSYGGWLAAYYASERGGLECLMLEDPSGIKEFHEGRIKSDPEFRERMIKNALELNPREGVLRSMLSSENGNEYLTRTRLNAIDVRTLVIWGAHDVTVDTKYAEWFRNYIKGSRIEILKDERHTPHYTNPEAVARLITDFTGKI